MTISRRRFLGSAAAVSLGFSGFRSTMLDPSRNRRADFGPLLPDPDNLLALPEGFGYWIISRHGDPMTDGFFVPARPDGMATFPGPGGRTLIVRNHEVDSSADPTTGAFGPRLELLDRLDRERLYDPGSGDLPALGGTTTLVFDTATQTLEQSHLSLAGTLRNCAGGPTPWGSWITCEETVARSGGALARDHGFCFEVPAAITGLPVRPVPLTAMGRFNHEAVAVHPASGVVYETEDDSTGLLYRFIPNVPGQLARGGRLQALAVRDQPSLDTRNFAGRAVDPGVPMQVRWIDVEDVEAPDDDLRQRGFAAGAARFARGEGIWHGRDEVFFACTNGGEARRGQIWRYRPSAHEGQPGEEVGPGTLELFIEPNDGTLVENADNLTVAPWGDLVVCEDGSGDDHLVGVTPAGETYKLARNMNGNGELAGVCFSPDGGTLFVNMQIEGLTLAITGPWRRGG
jgi:secreted PhoX family phosphatase